MPDDDTKKLLRAMRRIELKLDVLVEAQNLGDEVARRREEQTKARAQRSEQFGEQMRQSYGP